MLPPPRIEKYQDSVDDYDSTDGIDEREFARIELIALELAKRSDRNSYTDYKKSYGDGRASLDYRYDASITKPIQEKNSVRTVSLTDPRGQKHLVDVSSVEVISSSQYATKKRKATKEAIKSIGYDHSFLANDCRVSYLYDDPKRPRRAPQSQLPSKATTSYAPFAPCAPLGMISLGQAISFYPKPRLVVEVVSPFNVVFANSAYYRLSGLSTERTLGSPLCKQLQTYNTEFSFNFLLKSVQKMEVGRHTSVNITTQSTDILSGNQVYGRLKCQMYAFPIVADVNCAYVKNYSSSSTSSSGLRNITHFLVELDCHDASLDLLEDLRDNGIDERGENTLTLVG